MAFHGLSALGSSVSAGMQFGCPRPAYPKKNVLTGDET